MTQDAGLFDALPIDIAARLAGPRARAARPLAGWPVPDLGRAGGGQDATCARARQRSAVAASRRAHRGALSDDAAHAPVGGRGGGPRRAAAARRARREPSARLRRRGDHLRAGRRRPGRLGGQGRGGHAGDRRRGAPSRRGPGVGRKLSAGVRRGTAMAAALGHAVSLRCHADPRRALRRRGPGRAGCVIHLRRSCRRRCVPPGGFRDLRRDAVVAQRRGRGRVLLRDGPDRTRGRSPLSHGDLGRAARGAGADRSRGGRKAPRVALDGPPRRGRARGRRRRRPRSSARQASARGDGTRAGGGAAHRRERVAQARGLPRFARAMDRGGEHGVRGCRHPAAARRRVRERRQDSLDLPSDRGSIRAHHPEHASRAELAVSTGRADTADARVGDRKRAAARAAPRGAGWKICRRPSGARASSRRAPSSCR
ncbi:MAG: hypothetical protein JWN10_2861 [Solirubrobacterales bacterium]|nr:hypothetical protein [Solirubrobacterales bacterium]